VRAAIELGRPQLFAADVTDEAIDLRHLGALGSGFGGTGTRRCGAGFRASLRASLRASFRASLRSARFRGPGTDFDHFPFAARGGTAFSGPLGPGGPGCGFCTTSGRAGLGEEIESTVSTVAIELRGGVLTARADPLDAVLGLRGLGKLLDVGSILDQLRVNRGEQNLAVERLAVTDHRRQVQLFAGPPGALEAAVGLIASCLVDAFFFGRLFLGVLVDPLNRIGHRRDRDGFGAPLFGPEGHSTGLSSVMLVELCQQLFVVLGFLETATPQRTGYESPGQANAQPEATKASETWAHAPFQRLVEDTHW
jgi:hypothetical protein